MLTCVPALTNVAVRESLSGPHSLGHVLCDEVSVCVCGGPFMTGAGQTFLTVLLFLAGCSGLLLSDPSCSSCAPPENTPE